MSRPLGKILTLVAALLVWLPGASAAQTAVEFYHTDPLGSVRLVTAESGALIERVDYDVFGETQTPSFSTRQFAGKERDLETGFDYFGGRYYAAALGRFSTVDPAYVIEENIANPQLFNRYTYAVNNPLRYTDPDGRLWDLVWDGYSIASGIASLRDNWRNGHYGSALVDGIGVGFDTLSAAVPGVPAVVGPSIRGVRAASRAVNTIPKRLARVVPTNVNMNGMLGGPDSTDVFVTAAADIAGMNAQQISRRLGIQGSPSGYQITEFATPKTGIASPVNRTNPGFVGGGRTSGGAREFVIPQQRIPSGATTRSVK